MNHSTFEQAIEIVRGLPPEERLRLRAWIEEQERHDQAAVQTEQLQQKEERFQKSLQWLDAHRAEYTGCWVALDGDLLLSHGTDGKQVYAEAQAAGIAQPLLHFVSENEDRPFGGW